MPTFTDGLTFEIEGKAAKQNPIGKTVVISGFRAVSLPALTMLLEQVAFETNYNPIPKRFPDRSGATPVFRLSNGKRCVWVEVQGTRDAPELWVLEI